MNMKNIRHVPDNSERPKRNIDERLDALAETVEILASMHQGTEAAMAKMESAMADLAITTNRMPNIVIRHEERLDSLDGGDQT
jgi:hypothetical protein